MAEESDSAAGASGADDLESLDAALAAARDSLTAGDPAAAERAAKALSAILRATREVEERRLALRPPPSGPNWEDLAHQAQRPPRSAWRVWVFLGGRGAGKTRAGAEWVRAQALSGRARKFALIAPTYHEAREIIVEGPSGLRALAPPKPEYEAGRRRLVWPNGAQAHLFTAEDPDGLRGPQFDAAWADEFCAWPKPADTLAILRLGLRLGARPQLVVTTTPRPIPALKALLAEEGVVLTQAATGANRANLAPGFVEAMEALWSGTHYGRQELDGVLVEAPEGALWTRDAIRRASKEEADLAREIVVAIDPPAGEGPGSDACGIVAVGAKGDGTAVVLADASVQGLGPAGWAARAVALADSLKAQRIVAEANNGGAMVRQTLLVAGAKMPIRLVHARADKRRRAEPVAALYAAGRVAHDGVFKALEDEMAAFSTADAAGSPDRVDALVWAVHDLLIERAAPRLRGL